MLIDEEPRPRERGMKRPWSTPNFPDDLWAELLSPLPVKSLFRFRSVSKTWRTLIDDPAFARSHLTRFNAIRPENQLLVDQECAHVRDCVLRCSKTFTITSKIASLRTPPKQTLPAYDGVEEWYVASSIDGLFILKNSCWRPTPVLMLWNPSIRKVRKVPLLLDTDKEMIIVEMCIGFDSVNNNYKHVRFVQSRDELQFVAVYSVKSNSWKRIEFQDSKWRRYFIFPNERASVCVRGVLYAINRRPLDHPLELVSFDLSNEKLDSTFLPDVFKLQDDYPVLTMANGGNSLAVVKSTRGFASIWVMQRNGDWSKRYTCALSLSGYDTCRLLTPRFLYLKKDGEALWDWGPMVKSYYGRQKIVEKKTCLCNVMAWVYMESLVLLK